MSFAIQLLIIIALTAFLTTMYVKENFLATRPSSRTFKFNYYSPTMIFRAPYLLQSNYPSYWTCS